jgi:ABC-2 type transport system permease protein
MRSSSPTTVGRMKTEVLSETLRERRRSLLWWTLGVVGLVGLTVAFYPSVKGAGGLSDYAKDLPKSLRGLFVGGEIDITSGPGYLNSQVFAMLAPLILLIFAIGAGGWAVAGEEERGTLDLLLAHPLRRGDFVAQRFAAVSVLVIALSTVLFVTVAVASALVDLEIGIGDLIAACGSNALLALLFGTLALAIGATWAGRARAITVATAFAIAAWMLDGLGQAVDWLNSFRPLSPFYQAIGTDPLRDGVSWGSWALLAGLTAMLLAAAVRGLERRDLRQ